MRTTSRSRSRAALAIALAFGSAAAVAGASWSAQGNGAAKAQAGRLEPVTATPATPSTQLFPGTTADSALTLRNTNPVAMSVSSIVANGPATSNTEGCDGDSVSFSNQSGTWEVAKNAQLTINLPNSVTMALDADDACQGATFTIPVAVTASVSGQGGASDPPPTTSTTAAAPASLSWSPTTYTFPDTEPGATSGAVLFVLRNTGGSPATVQTGTLGGPDFLVDTNTCVGQLNPNQSCGVNVRFRPSTTGMRNGVLEARNAGDTAWTTATLSGVGQSPANLQIQPGGRDFGSQQVGTETANYSFQVMNMGAAPARNVAVSIIGADANSFLYKGTSCGQVTGGGGSTCFVTVAFRPTHAGANNAQLQVSYTTATQSRAAVATLTGTGL